MAELKNCPFCGSPAELRHSSTWDYFVRCANKGCAARTRNYHENETGAVNAWNERTAAVVFCEECRHYVSETELCERILFAVEPDDYCAWGKRAER